MDMAKKTQTRTDAKETRRALRALSAQDLAQAAGGFKPGQYSSSSGGGGGNTN